VRTEFNESFVKDLRGIRNTKVLDRIRQAIEAVETVDRLEELAHIKKLQGGGNYYRLRVGDYRMGLIVRDDLVVFVRVLNRKEIYRYFP